MSQAKGGINVTQVDTTPQFKLGTIVEHVDSSGYLGFYQYVKSGAASTQYSAYAISNAFVLTATALVTGDVSATTSKAVGVPQHANFTAADQYGWVFVGPGRFIGKVGAGCPVGSKLNTVASAAGYLMNSTSSTYPVLGATTIDSFATSTTGLLHAATKMTTL